MFDLDKAIAEWRRELAAGGIRSRAVLDELESHLREDMDRKSMAGASEEETFAIAVRQIGRAHVLQGHFTKAGDGVSERLKRVVFVLTGIPNPQFATIMNTPDTTSTLEPRWATYFKAGAFGMPAALLWLVSIVFLMPKLQQMCLQAGTAPFTFPDAPAVFRGAAFVGRGMILLTRHALLTAGPILLVFLGLEWRSRQWPRYRRAAVGVGTFALNLAVLISITLMVVTAIIAASIVHHVK